MYYLHFPKIFTASAWDSAHSSEVGEGPRGPVRPDQVGQCLPPLHRLVLQGLRVREYRLIKETIIPLKGRLVEESVSGGDRLIRPSYSGRQSNPVPSYLIPPLLSGVRPDAPDERRGARSWLPGVQAELRAVPRPGTGFQFRRQNESTHF